VPLSKYFRGSGSRVMESMKDRYGAEKGERIFYATATKKGMKPKEHKSEHARRLLAGGK